MSAIPIIGGTAQHFLGEYMAGGMLVVMELPKQSGELHTANDECCGRDAADILSQPFTKLILLSSRPCGRLYAR